MIRLWGSFIVIISLNFINTGRVFSQEIPHKELKLECNACHITENWDNISYDHNRTDFPLDGQHHNIGCVNCHTLENFSDVQSGCKFCHLDVHQGKLTYPCEQCHTTTGWQVLDIYMVHANTTFPMLGSHSRLDCAACHKTEIVGEFARVQSDCFSCHEQDYRSTQDPKHSEYGFGHRCEDCHGMLAWIPGAYAEHEVWFPISSGTHTGEWENCGICHPNPNNYQEFTCLSCHEHSAANTMSRHEEVRGFSYDSDACYRCHRTGRGGD